MPDNDTQAKLEALRLSYLASLPDKHSAIHVHWQRLVEHWDGEHFDALYIVLHGLAGSAETFGLPHITQEARDLVNTLKLLSKNTPPEPSTLDKLESDLTTFLAHLESVPGR